MDRQVRDLLDAVVGELPHRVTVEAVRRRVAGRRAAERVAAAAAVVLIAGIGVGGPAHAAAPRPAGTIALPAGVPHYYVEQGFNKSRGFKTVVRRTATGAVTATISCPRRQARDVIGNIVPAGHQTFFMACERVILRGTEYVVTGSRIYRFRITISGRVSGYSMVRGTVLNGFRTGGLAVTPDGSEVAVGVSTVTAPSVRFEIMVINTRTGKHAVWKNRPAVPGTIIFGVGDLSFARDGRELVFLSQRRCIRGKKAPHCKVSGGEEMLALSPAASGGLLAKGRVLLLQSKIMRLSTGYINDGVITPDGSALTLAIVNSQTSSQPANVTVVQFSAATGKRLRVLYRMRTGNGFSYRFFSADPSGRHLLLDAGPTGGAVNGWIDHGRLVRLKPAGDNVFFEVW